MDTLINVFAKNTGPLVRWITAAIVAGIVAALAHFGFALEPKDTAELSAFVALIVAGWIGEYVAKMQKQNIAKIQEAVQVIAPEVRTDGTAGAVTVAAVQRAAGVIQDIKLAGHGGTHDEKNAARAVSQAMKPQ